MLDFLKDAEIPLWIKILMFVVVAEVLRRIFGSRAFPPKNHTVVN